MATLRAFLDARRVTSASWNLTGLGGGWTGKYYVAPSDYDTFLRLHAAYCTDGRASTLLERHGSLGAPILIDLDFRYTFDTDPERKFTATDVRQFVADYVTTLRDVTGYDAPLRVFVMMRPAPRNDSAHNVTKDGIHIVIPDVTVPYDVQFATRDMILSRGAVSSCFRDFTNPETDVFDKSVVKVNNWFLFGATKPETEAYTITDCVVVRADGAVSPTEWPENVDELTRLFSLQYGRDRLTDRLTVVPMAKETGDPRDPATVSVSVVSESVISHIC